MFINTACKSEDRTQPYDKYDHVMYVQSPVDFAKRLQNMPAKNIEEIQKKLKANNPIWEKTYKHEPKMMNVQLFEDYLKEDQRAEYKNDVNITSCFDNFKKFLQDPSDINTKALVDCISNLKKENVEPYINKQCTDFNNFSLPFSQVTLTWMKYWKFIMQDAEEVCITSALPRDLELGNCILATWQEQRGNEVQHAASEDKGKILWNILLNELRHDNAFDKNNKERCASIEACLDKLYLWSLPNGFTKLTIKDYETTIPTGLKTLNAMIENHRNAINNTKNKKAIEALEELAIYVSEAKSMLS